MTTKHTNDKRQQACASFNRFITELAKTHNLTVDETCEIYACFMHMYSSHYSRLHSITDGHRLQIHLQDYYTHKDTVSYSVDERYWGLVGGLNWLRDELKTHNDSGLFN